MKIDLSTQAGYDIASAIRGPDADAVDAKEHYEAAWLKMLFTARIRQVVGTSEDTCWTRTAGDSWDEWVGWADLATIFEEITQAGKYGHYLRHVQDALLAIDKLGIPMPDLSSLIWAYRSLQTRNFDGFKASVQEAREFSGDCEEMEDDDDLDN